MTKQSTLGLGMVTAGVAVAVAAFLLFASQAFAAGSVSASATEATAGGTSTVEVVATAGSGHGIGNWTIDLTFEPLDYTGNPTCSSNAAGSLTVNPGGASGIVRFGGATGEPTGLTGDVVIGTCTFTPSGAAGDCSAVGITVGRMDDENGNALGPSASGDEVCVAAAVTDSPTPVPGTATPTAVQPSKAPTTGGELSSGSGMNSLTWLLALSGLAIVAAGAWTLSRARRED
jgi:hypothetical protein